MSCLSSSLPPSSAICKATFTLQQAFCNLCENGLASGPIIIPVIPPYSSPPFVISPFGPPPAIDIVGISISGDGKTAAIGASLGGTNNLGGLQIYTSNGVNNVWTEGPFLESNMGSFNVQGISPSLNYNGTLVAYAGEPLDNGGLGYVWIFIKNGDGTWGIGNTNNNPNFTLSGTTNDNNSYGDTVRLSGDGSTLVVGSARSGSPETGAFYVYYGPNFNNTPVRVSNSSASLFGNSISINENASIIVTGAPGTNSNVGAAFVYNIDSSTVPPSWILAQTLLGTGSLPPPAHQGQGVSVSLSADGSTIAVGAPSYNNGYIFIFIFQGGSWVQQDAITTAMSSSSFATNVDLTEDGNTFTAGASNIGEVFVYSRKSSTWSLMATLTNILNFGQFTVISNTGEFILIANVHTGTIYFYQE